MPNYFPQSTRDEDSEILERLRHPEREGERRRTSRNLFIRNILNSIFILMAIVAMIGMLVTPKGQSQQFWLLLGLLAVLLKMVEVMMRMPHIKK